VTVLEARDLVISATLNGERVEAVRHLSFALAPGRVLGVVGESGAGKSMIARAIGQHLPPGFAITGGALLLDGEDLAHLTPQRRRSLLGRDIAFVPQEPMTSLNPVQTIGTQFAEHLRHLGINSRRARRDRALALLDEVHLSDGAALLRRYPHQLSGGMCQRVLIAMAFASRPRILVADEPTTALDVTIQARIVRLLAELQRLEGTAVLFITHDLRLASRICDDIVVLYAGRAVEQGPAATLLASPEHPYTRCLQLSAPTMQGPRRALFALADRMPGLNEAASLRGCHFAPRCPVASLDCTNAAPPDRTVASNHVTACLHPLRTTAIVAPEPVVHPPHVSSTPLLRVEALGKRFRTWAVRNASFAIGEGEFVGLVGESGSGKSTIARLIMGLERPTTGRISLSGKAQMVFQDPQSALNPRRRIADIVTQTMQAGRNPAPRDERMRRAAELLTEVGLGEDMLHRYPAQLSGGQRQRVNIARALCSVPHLLVADEIVSGLDVSVQAQLLALLQRLRAERGIALLFISHDLSVVRHLCERVLVMHRGDIVEQGATERVFTLPAHPYTNRLLAAVPPDDISEPWRPFPDEAEAVANAPPTLVGGG
jgi:peptide/nickel transport system ATP-binding protein